MKKCLRAIFLFAIMAMTFNLAACGQEQTTNPTTTPEKVAQPLPKLLDLGAKKCVPCKMMAPVLEELAKEYSGVLDVEFVDVWQTENKNRALQHKIRAIPTQIFFDENGKELFRHEGFMSKADILNKWKELGYSFEARDSAGHLNAAG